MIQRWTCRKLAPFLAAVLAVLAISVPGQAKQLCKVQVDCPANFDGDTLYVPDSVVMLSQVFQHCSPDSFREAVDPNRLDTISLFFVIDHSASMSVMDPLATRYSVTERLIDSLFAKSPASEVGIAVFSNRLLHSYKDDRFFTALDTSQGWPDSYVPLTRLNTNVGSMTAVQKLKWAIALSPTPNDTDTGKNRRLLNADYGLTGRRNGFNDDSTLTGYNGTTDITLGFEAAKKAFLSASNPKHKQFIIFLSDGVHQYVDLERKRFDTLYIDGQNVPTTFTAFFINETQPIPIQIRRMTNNIRNNGYSSRNPTSDVWKTAGTEANLISRLLDITVGNNQRLFPSTPSSLTINGVRTTQFDNDMAFFSDPFLLTGIETRFDLTFAFIYDHPLNLPDTIRSSYVVKRSNRPPPGKAFFTESECWEQGRLELFYDGSPVPVVEAHMKSLQVRFYPPSAFPVDAVNLEIVNASGSDRLLVTTDNNGSYFSRRFNRTFGTPAIDDTLQNGFNDSVIVIYRNPKIPLDTIRLAVRVRPPRDLEVARAYYLDQAGGIANGHPDVIRVELGDSLSLEEISRIKDFIDLPDERGIALKTVVKSAKGFDIVLEEPTSSTPFTGLYPNERLRIPLVPDLPGGGWFPPADVRIVDSMAPVIVSATYYDIADPQGVDTLRVTFSERSKPVASAQPFDFLSGSNGYKLSLSFIRYGADSLTAVFGVPGGQTTPRQGDSIWISTTSNIADTAGIRQAKPNVKRVLDYRQLYRIVSAEYLDNNGDGLIDIVRVTMDRPPDAALLSELYKTTQLPDYRKFQYTAGDMKITATGFEIAVTQGPGSEPFTSVDSRDSLRIAQTLSSNNGLIEKTTVGITDKMAPVIKTVVFNPNTTDTTKNKGTLVVTFSESINPPTDPTPFIFVDSTGKTYEIRLRATGTAPGATQTFEILSFDQFPAPKDSVRIDPTAGVTDTKANVQNRENRPSPLEVGAIVITFDVKAGPTPFDPRGGGMVNVLVYPTGLAPSYTDVQGTLRILDCVGNLIAKDIKGTPGATAGSVKFSWNGTNLAKRYVASGSYLGIATMDYIEKSGEARKKKEVRFKIAIQN